MRSLKILAITFIAATAVFVGCADQNKDDNKDQEVSDIATQYNYCVQNRGDVCNRVRPTNGMSLDEFRGAGRTTQTQTYPYQTNDPYYRYGYNSTYAGPVQPHLLNAYFDYLKNSLSKEELKAFSNQLNWVGQGADYDLRRGSIY